MVASDRVVSRGDVTADNERELMRGQIVVEMVNATWAVAKAASSGGATCSCNRAGERGQRLRRDQIPIAHWSE